MTELRSLTDRSFFFAFALLISVITGFSILAVLWGQPPHWPPAPLRSPVSEETCARIPLGVDIKEVEELMGRPSSVNGCGLDGRGDKAHGNSRYWTGEAGEIRVILDGSARVTEVRFFPRRTPYGIKRPSE